jgi:hypothetical protein
VPKKVTRETKVYRVPIGNSPKKELTTSPDPVSGPALALSAELNIALRRSDQEVEEDYWKHANLDVNHFFGIHTVIINLFSSFISILI